MATRPSNEPIGGSVFTPFGTTPVQRQSAGSPAPETLGAQLLRAAGHRAHVPGNGTSYSFPLPANAPVLPCPMPSSKSTCPPYGAKAVCGRRSKMEDAYAIQDDFVSAPNLLLEPVLPALLPTKHSEALTGTQEGSTGGGGFIQSQDSDDFNNKSDTRPASCSESPSDSLHFFAVFDGHGGVEAAKHCADCMDKNLFDSWKKNIGGDVPKCRSSHDRQASTFPVSSGIPPPAPPTSQDIQKVFVDAFIKTDDQFRSEDVSALVGSTAVTVLVGQRYYLVANCGDSRAVLCRSGQAHPLTVDHKPEREDEMARVEKAGGQVWFWNGARVMGVLAMSRAIGDRSLRPYVIPEPEVTIVPRTLDDTLIIIATDGLWDVVSDQEACTLAMKCLDRAQQKGATASDAARLTSTVLIRAAMDRGSRDNITVVVIDLRTSKAAQGGAVPGGPQYLNGMQASNVPSQGNGNGDSPVAHVAGAELEAKGIATGQVVAQ